jgi:hypothetical protein
MGSLAQILSERPNELLKSRLEATDPDWANAFERASAAGGSFMLLPGESYPVGRALALGDSDVSFWSPVPAKAQGAPSVSTTLTSGALFTLGGANVTMSGFAIGGPGASAGSALTLIKGQRDSASDPADLDIRLHGMSLHDAGTLFAPIGRGVICDGRTLFSDFVTAVDIDHPTSFAAPSSFATSLRGGARKYMFDQPYFHNGSGRCLRIEGTNGQYVYGLQVLGAHHDDNCQFFRGYLNDAVIAGTMAYRMGDTASFTIDAFSILGSRNAQIIGNNVGGDRWPEISLDPDSWPLRRVRRCFYLTGSHVGLQIADNLGFGAIREFLLADTGCTIDDFDFSRNDMAYVCLGNEAANYSAIHSNAATLSNGKILDNRLRIPAMANNGANALLRKSGGSWDGVEYLGNRSSGGMPGLLDTPTSGGLRQHDEGNWMFFTSAGVAKRSATYPAGDGSGSAI